VNSALFAAINLQICQVLPAEKFMALRVVLLLLICIHQTVSSSDIFSFIDYFVEISLTAATVVRMTVQYCISLQ